MNQETVYENPGQELDRKAHAYADKRGCSYAEAMLAVAREDPDLARRYNARESHAERKFGKAAEERERRVVVYQSEFNVNKKRATEMVDEHDPIMRNIPLDPGDVVAARTEERMAKGVKDYGEAMQAVLADDPHLAHCYNKNLPYVEASGAHAYQDQMPNVGAKQQLGVLINGARLASNAPDVELMIQIANLTPALVRDAASERLDEIAWQIVDNLAMRGEKSERYPETLRQARAEHPELVAASESGVLNETALREIYYPWFTDRD